MFVKYLIYAVLSQFKICCDLHAFVLPNQYSQNFRVHKKIVFSKSVVSWFKTYFHSLLILKIQCKDNNPKHPDHVKNKSQRQKKHAFEGGNLLKKNVEKSDMSLQLWWFLDLSFWHVTTKTRAYGVWLFQNLVAKKNPFH